jgi:Ribosomal L27 protein
LSQFHAGKGVGVGKDYTLFALQEGIVVFQKSKYQKKVGMRTPDLSDWRSCVHFATSPLIGTVLRLCVASCCVGCPVPK